MTASCFNIKLYFIHVSLMESLILSVGRFTGLFFKKHKRKRTMFMGYVMVSYHDRLDTRTIHNISKFTDAILIIWGKSWVVFEDL